MGKASTPASVRFWTKVDKTGPCWLWTAADSGVDGYGVFRLSKTPAVMVRAHRFAYEESHGPIPAGLHLDHLCRVRRCVNPDHLEPVSPGENVLRGVGHTAVNARKTHCVHGHPFDGANTRIDRHGHRRCRACARQSRS